MTPAWDAAAPGVLVLPSGRAVRGRGLRRPLPPGPVPGIGVYLLRDEPPPTAWPSTWIPWRDFGLPSDSEATQQALREAWVRSAHHRVEIACRGGRGRTGTALACLAVIDGVRPADAIAYVREHYDRRAVETPWQRRFVEHFDAQVARSPRCSAPRGHVPW